MPFVHLHVSDNQGALHQTAMVLDTLPRVGDFIQKSKLDARVTKVVMHDMGDVTDFAATVFAQVVSEQQTRRLISSGSRFEKEIGYSRAVVDGDHVWVSGTTGYDYAAMTIAEDVVAQADQAFRNIATALAEAGAGLDDVVRVLFIVPRREDWEPCWPVVKRYLGKAKPASTLIHAGLQTDAMRIEIEVTARLPKGTP